MENTTSIEKITEVPCVLIYKNVFEPDSFIEKIEEEAKRPWPYLQWGKSVTGDYESRTESEYRTSLEISLINILNDDVNEELKDLKEDLVENIVKPIDQVIWDYRSIYDLTINESTGYQLLKYLNDCEYHIHHDHAPDNSRVLSMVACLSDGFEGGELEFPYFKYSLKLEKGSVVFFPSNFPYAHIAHPVTSGIKYSLVSWYR